MTSSHRWRRSPTVSTISRAPARSFMEASPISRLGGLRPPPTRLTSEAGLPSPQFRFNTNLLPWTPERERLPMADGFGLGVMGYSPMAAGILTGKYRKGERGRATGELAQRPRPD